MTATTGAVQTPALPPRVADYVSAIVESCEEHQIPLVSIVLFGSAISGGYQRDTSDVDLLLVVADETPNALRERLRANAEHLEARLGLRESSHPPSAIERFARRVTANVCSFFVCSRSDLLSGDPARILALSRFQALFVDRAVVPSVVCDAAIAHGEDLLGSVPLKSLRRLDVFKAFFGLASQVVLSAAMYPFVPAATKYAMDALKRSVHNCYLCYHGHLAPLEVEVAFFAGSGGRAKRLGQLLDLRSEYRGSFAFVLGCLPAIARLHVMTAVTNRFPRVPFLGSVDNG